MQSICTMMQEQSLDNHIRPVIVYIKLSLGDSTLSWSHHDHVDSSINDISKNLSQAYCSGREDGVFKPETNVETYTPGIKLISISPKLSSVQHMHFTDCTIIQNHALAGKVFFGYWTQICLGFAWIFYTSSDTEFEKLAGEAATTVGSIGISTKPFILLAFTSARYPIQDAAKPLTSWSTTYTSIPDSAREVADDTQIVTFDSKLHGGFTKQQCLELIRQHLSNIRECKETAILLKAKVASSSIHTLKEAQL